MKILIDINHPAHVHLLRNTYALLVKNGHEVIVTVKEIPSAVRLLNLYGIPFVNLGQKNDSIAKKGLNQVVYDWRIFELAKKHHIDIAVGSSINITHVSKMCKMRSVVMDDDDDEVEPLFVKFGHPFADAILTPSAIIRKSKKAIYVNSYHELAYLHPNVFHPNPQVLQEVGVEEGEPFFVVRFNAFKAHHDVGAAGLSMESKLRLLDCLKAKGKVFITTERDIDDEFKSYQLSVSPEKIHSLIHYAAMLIGDSQTMTSEAAVLGTPAIKCNSFAGRLSVPNELEQKYGLCYSFLPNQVEAFFAKIDELLAISCLKEEWKRRRQKMLGDKIDYSQFFTWFIENYPESRKIMRENPDYQWRFK